MNTKEIRDKWFSKNEILCDDNSFVEMAHDFRKALDRIDELERKLKIAEDALSFYGDQESWIPKEVNGGELMSRAIIFGATIAYKALKQIRGEEPSDIDKTGESDFNKAMD